MDLDESPGPSVRLGDQARVDKQAIIHAVQGDVWRSVIGGEQCRSEGSPARSMWRGAVSVAGDSEARCRALPPCIRSGAVVRSVP
jgi:hypothetical protein